MYLSVKQKSVGSSPALPTSGDGRGPVVIMVKTPDGELEVQFLPGPQNMVNQTEPGDLGDRKV